MRISDWSSDVCSSDLRSGVRSMTVEATTATVDALLAREDFGTLSEMLAAHAAERPDHPAVIEGSDSLTYAELNARVARVAAALQRDGAQDGQKLHSIAVVTYRSERDSGRERECKSVYIAGFAG